MTSHTMRKLVQATRTARDTAEVLDSDKLFDNVFCNLMDAIYEITGEIGDMETSLSFRLIHSNLTDAEVANALLATAK